MSKFPPSANVLGVVAVVVVVVILSIVSVVPHMASTTTTKTTQTGVDGVNPSGVLPSGVAELTPGALASEAPGQNSHNGGSNVSCAPGHNGGATDTGVTGTEIRVASTLAESGTAASFLGDARYGMQAIVDATNRSGGICGRVITPQFIDDAFSPQNGEIDIKNFIQEGYFALPVVPSSQGLDAAARGHVIDNAGIPVVGSDGMLYSQYSDPWVWPVATSTISTAHIAAMNAYQAGSRSFGIVYDSTYYFGPEGDAAFKGAVQRLGGHVDADVGIAAGQQDYRSDVAKFESGCHPCDTTFMLLDPTTAISWIRSDTSGQGKNWIFGSKRTAGPQPLFTSNFGQACGQLCNGMWVWTGFKAPFQPFSNEPAVAQYVHAIRSVSNTADVNNQFLEGSYVGMQLFMEALKRAGPLATRSRLREVMDSMDFDSGLTQPLHWRAGNHFANTSMLGFTIQFSQAFNGFQYQQTDWVKDPWYNLDHP